MLRYAKDAEQNQLEEDFDPDKDEAFYEKQAAKVQWYDKILLNRPLKVVATLLVLAVAVPVLVYHFVFAATLDLPASDGYSTGSCLLPRSRRIPCGADNISSNLCHPQCCYDEENGICFHRLPSRFSYIMDRSWTENVTLHPRIGTEPFARQPAIPSLRLSVNEVSASHLTFKIYDPTKVEPLSGHRLEEKHYDYDIAMPELDITVRSGNRTLLKTDNGPLIASDNIWEISFHLTDEMMYGFEEIPLLPGTKKVVYNGRDGASSIPLVFARSDGSFHGLLFGSASPTEVQVLPENHLLFRTITDESIEFHVFVGPTPSDVMHDVMKHTGGPPDFSYWTLGAHFCSEGGGVEALTEVLAGASLDGVPLDSHCGVAPLALGAEGAESAREGARAVHDAGVRFVPHLSPYIKFVEPEETSDSTEVEVPHVDPTVSQFGDLLLLDPDTRQPYLGSVDDSRVLYPDYALNRSAEILTTLWPFDEVSGVTLENNWPLDESDKRVNETHLYLPYFSKDFENSFRYTLPWNVSHVDRELRRPQHLHHHNTYGEHFADVVRELIDSDERAPLYSTSQWMNSRTPLNRQFVNATWANLRRELVIAALGSVSGSWLRSTPVCGDTEHFDPATQTQLCVNWYQAATYLPLLKVHSKGVRRDPLAFLGMDRYYMIQALNRRLSLLPYFSTVLQSGPLLRPMFYQFPEAVGLHDLTSQFSVGDSIVIVPNLLPQQTLLNVWVPPGTWYEMGGGLKMDPDGNGVATMPSATADFLTIVRGGDVVVMQEDVRDSAETTRLHSAFSFVVALDCSFNATNATEPLLDAHAGSHEDEESCHAEGELILSEGMTWRFTADSETLTIRPYGDDWASFCDATGAVWAAETKSVKVYGLDGTLNNFDTYRYHEVNAFLCVMQMTGQTVIRFV